MPYNFPSKAIVSRVKEQYKPGDRVMLDYMDDSYAFKPKVGDVGTVKFVDDIGTIHVSWDCGSSLGVVYGEDRCHKI